MLDKIKKLNIGDTEYNFKMTNRTILKADEKYGNYATVLQGLMEGKQFYTNALKLLSCTCIEKDWKFDELTDTLTGEQMQSISNFVMDLYFEYMGLNEKKEDNKTEKN